MATAFFLSDLDNKLLIVGNGEFLQSKDSSFGGFAVYHRHIVLGAERFKYQLLHGGTLDNLLIHNLEADIIDIERNVRCVFQLGVEIKKPVVGINGFQKKLYPETL